jgi:DNA-binding NarL/FixJ family response regulator
MTSVLVSDDHPIVRQGCRRMLEDLGVECIPEASDEATGSTAAIDPMSPSSIFRCRTADSAARL